MGVDLSVEILGFKLKNPLILSSGPRGWNGEALKRAAMRGIKKFLCDLSKDPIPLPSESVNLVTALEVIDHLLNPDHILREIYRVLIKKMDISLSQH